MTNEIRITDNFMFATVMKDESINVIRIRNPERRVLLEYFFGAEPNDELTRAMD